MSSKAASKKRKIDADAAAPVEKKSKSRAVAAVAQPASAVRAPDGALEAAFAAKIRAKAGVVLSFGSNECLQLGLGDEISERKKPGIVQAFAGHNVVDIACGGLHNAAITADGRVWTWGCNDEKALGHEHDEGAEWLPAPVGGALAGQKVVQAVGGDSYTVVLTASGQCYGWGTYRDLAGIIGYSRGVRLQVEPALIQGALAAHTVVALTGGENAVVALTRTGEVFEWGNPRVGAAAYESLKVSRLAPVRVVFPRGKRVAHVFSGNASFFALTTSGEVYAWGLNNYSQCGVDRASVGLKIDTPLLVPELSNRGVVAIAGGTFHSLALLADGGVLSCGSGTYGQHGHGHHEDVLKFTAIAALAGTRVVQIECGGSHSLATDAQGRVHAWGFGEMLQLGTGENADEIVPTRVDGLQLETRDVLKACAGGQHTVLLAEEK